MLGDRVHRGTRRHPRIGGYRARGQIQDVVVGAAGVGDIKCVDRVIARNPARVGGKQFDRINRARTFVEVDRIGAIAAVNGICTTTGDDSVVRTAAGNGVPTAIRADHHRRTGSQRISAITADENRRRSKAIQCRRDIFDRTSGAAVTHRHRISGRQCRGRRQHQLIAGRACRQGERNRRTCTTRQRQTRCIGKRNRFAELQRHNRTTGTRRDRRTCYGRGGGIRACNRIHCNRLRCVAGGIVSCRILHSVDIITRARIVIQQRIGRARAGGQQGLAQRQHYRAAADLHRFDRTRRTRACRHLEITRRRLVRRVERFAVSQGQRRILGYRTHDCWCCHIAA